MKKSAVKGSIPLFVLVILLVIPGCDDLFMQGSGYLEGKISIGPLCPVEKYPPDPGCLPTAETYKAYPVSVWTSNGKREITHLDPAPDGSYRVQLLAGSYMVRLDNNNRPGGS